ncbi:MAG: ABC transporter ATP-binding protein [Clostridium sp.]|uniref:ABC transporter ATP-binding protein n=1 Tax=Clostridium sp. TaxID=1506 RepID=UPI003029B362
MGKNSILELKKDMKIGVHFLKLAQGMSKSYIPMLVIASIFKAMVPFINIIIPKFIIDELMNGKRTDVFIKLVLIAVVGNFLLNLINRWLDVKVEIKNLEITNGFDVFMGKTIMDMDFHNIEDPEVLDLKERAIQAIKNQGAIQRLIQCIINAFTQIITIIGLTSLIATLDIYILLFIMIIVMLNSFIYKKSQEVQFEVYRELAPLNRAFGYYANLTSDFSMGKDVRLYNIKPLIMDKIKKYNSESLNSFGKLFRIVGKYQGLEKVNLQFQMAAIYGYMTYKVFKGTIGIGSFTMYAAAANNFSTTISSFILNFIELRQGCKYLEPYMQLEEIKSSSIQGNRNIEDIDKCKIEFRNVSFKYPRSKDYTLKNISIIIESGEKLSVVGLNGAGKTTFIKLLTRLYEPTEGEILLNEININEYSNEEYMKLLSVVFQDFKLMAFSVKENIALNNYKGSKDEDIENALIESGLEKDILKLPKGMDTHIYKTFEEDGIEFSGGQAQKLAISRSVYKDSPIVVLDEPTAALDPIAEFEIYSKFNELIGGKTAIYISHRLSSCKFCDKVAVFHNGEIIQHGTHDELINEKDSEYETMYVTQAQYYV